MTSLAIVRATMVLATVAWAVGEVLMRRSGALDRRARAAWTIGIALAAVHVVLAFTLVYHWDHGAAVAATSRQTASLVGSSWDGAIYVNYAFLTLWLSDVVWWWVSPVSHAARSPRLEIARLSLFAFMFFNGAVVFATWPSRIVGGAAVLAALIGSGAKAGTVTRS